MASPDGPFQAAFEARRRIAARALALRGVVVEVYEAGAKAGGCCATTRVAGYIFDDGALFVALPGLLDALFALLALAALFRQGYFIPEGGMGRIPEAVDRAASCEAADALLEDMA